MKDFVVKKAFDKASYQAVSNDTVYNALVQYMKDLNIRRRKNRKYTTKIE